MQIKKMHKSRAVNQDKNHELAFRTFLNPEQDNNERKISQKLEINIAKFRTQKLKHISVKEPNTLP